MKRLLTMLLSFCMILSIGAHTAAAAETTLLESENGVLLSSLDDEECRVSFESGRFYSGRIKWH